MPSNRQLPSPSALQTSIPGDGPDDALGKVGRFTEMTSLPVLIIVGVLATASPAPATCGWFGTQLQCDVGRAGWSSARKPPRSRPMRARFRSAHSTATADSQMTTRHPGARSRSSFKTSARTRVSAGRSGTRPTATDPAQAPNGPSRDWDAAAMIFFKMLRAFLVVYGVAGLALLGIHGLARWLS